MWPLANGAAASHQVFYLGSRDHGDIEILFPLGGQLQDRGIAVSGEDHEYLGIRRLQPVLAYQLYPFDAPFRGSFPELRPLHPTGEESIQTYGASVFLSEECHE